MQGSVPDHSHSATNHRDKVPFLQKLAIGFGEAITIGRQGIEHLTMPIYNITLGVNPALVASVLGLVRFVDAFSDPLAGWVSDNSKSRWGRRKPFMLAAAIVCALIFPLIWFVPTGWPETAYVAYLAIALFLYFAVYSFFDIPLIALAFEATPDYHERTRVQAYKALFVSSMGIVSAWLFTITQLDAFDGTMHGARVAGIAVGLTILVVGLIPILTVREGFRKIALEEVVKREKRLSFFKYLTFTFSNRPFLMLLIMQLAMGLGGATGPFGLYIMIFYVYGGDTKAGAILGGTWSTVYQVSTVAAIPLVTWSATRLGKIPALRIFLFLNVIVAVLNWFVYTPALPFLAVATAALLGPSQTASYMMLRSIIADICDHDELRTGLRREGSFGAMYSWTGKVIGSVATAVSGALLVWFGFNATLGGQQDPDTIVSMRIAFTVLPLVAALTALILVSFFPLTEVRSREIRAELEKRRGLTTRPAAQG